MAFPNIRGGPVDRGSFDRLRSSIDPSWILAALYLTGTASVRRRRLPAEQVLWLVLGMALFRNLPIDEVVRELELALPAAKKGEVAASAIVQARGRLGPAPLRWLFQKCAEVWASQSADRHRWRGLRVYGLDGTTVRVPDSVQNRAFFGGQNAGGKHGTSGYPLVRMVTLMVLRSHLVLDARFGPHAHSEIAQAKELWPQIPDESLAIVDRNFLSAAILIPLANAEKKRHCLIRAKKNTTWRVLKKIGRGDQLVEMTVSGEARRKDPSLPASWTMRALRYQRRGFQPQMLLTSLLDGRKFPAAEIVELYHERWEIELGYDEVKTEMLEREECIRSRTRAGVEQELWGLLLGYNLIRLEMERVAAEAKVPPVRVSFIAGLRFIRTAFLSLVFTSPGAIPKRLQALREDLAYFILPPRRPQRAYPRAVKIKMSNYPRKRPTTPAPPPK